MEPACDSVLLREKDAVAALWTRFSAVDQQMGCVNLLVGLSEVECS